MLTIEDALLMRAEFCHGSINYNEYKGVVLPVYESIKNAIDVVPATWIGNAELAMWQSLLTREVLLTGGINA